MAKMKAAILYSPGDMKIEELDIPELGPGDVLVRNSVTLTCGTDLKTFRRGHPLAKLPMVIGHEFAGVVENVGQDVTRFRPGMRAVAANSAPCNQCYFCAKGQPNLCERLGESILGFTSQGTYAQYVRIPANIVRQNTHTIPEDVSFEEAALLEPLSCVVHGNDLAEAQENDEVAVIGAGPIGLLHLQVLKSQRVRRVVVVDISESRLKAASNLGATEIIDASGIDPVERVRNISEGRGVDVVIEAVGRQETWQQACSIVRKGGRVLLFGGCPAGTTVPFATDLIHYGELTLKGAFHHTPDTVRRAMNLISSHTIDSRVLITHTMPLEKLSEAFDLMSRGTAVKVSITP